jgi:hypothetical protein
VTGTAFLKALLGLAAAAIGAVVIYFAVIFEGPFPDHPVLRGQNDLVLHVAAFLVVSTPLLLLGRWNRTIAALVVFAGMIEFVQIFQQRRNADLGDFLGSVAGIALAALLVMGLCGIRSLVASNKEQTND